MISHQAHPQKFSESFEWYQMFPPLWGWGIRKSVLMQNCESIKWCKFLKDKWTISSKLINAWSHLARPCLEFALQKYLCNFTKIIIYDVLGNIFFSHHPRQSLWAPSSHIPSPMHNLFYQYTLILPHLKLPINGAYSMYTCSCFTMLYYFLLYSKVNQLCICGVWYIYPFCNFFPI